MAELPTGTDTFLAVDSWKTQGSLQTLPHDTVRHTIYGGDRHGYGQPDLTRARKC